jgi:hypothetical protein
VTRDEKDLIQTKFVVTDWNEDYALDCDTDNANAIADTLGTLIRDLIKLGILNTAGTVSA